MKRKRFSVEHIVAILKQAELGAPVAELIRHLGIAEQTFYRWKREVLSIGVEMESGGDLLLDDLGSQFLSVDKWDLGIDQG